MEQWEYKIEEIIMEEKAVKNTGIWGKEMILMPRSVRWDGDKMITKSMEITKEFEERFNDLGKEGWELCGTTPIARREGANPGGSNTEKVYFIFKRKKA